MAMHPDDLDLAYSALCEAMTRVGESRTPLLLASFCLSLMARHEDPDEVKKMLAQAEAACEL